MKYRGIESFSHDAPARIGVLVCNLGTPEAPTRSALRRYLAEFLSDPRVVEAPRWLWQLILRGIILNTRPARSARAYEKIWTDEGSPLAINSRAIADGIRRELDGHGADTHMAPGPQCTVRLAMRYGQPAIGDVLDDMTRKGVRRVFVLPLYPQYSGSTSGSVFDAVARWGRRQRWVPDLTFVGAYYRNGAYLDALAQSVRRYQRIHGTGEHLLMSFHGIPRQYFDAGDPYHCHCQYTGRELASRLGLAEDDFTICFQSRFGPKKWLTPYTDEVLRALAGQGIRRVAVICPGFAADCLETLEEIGVQYDEEFRAAGGTRLDYIPALNADDMHVRMLATLVAEHISPWIDPRGEAERREAARATLERANALGATR